MPKRVSIVTLGCPKNFVEAENLAGILIAKGYDISNNLNNSDYAILHTCSFIHDAKAESEKLIKSLSTLKRKGKLKKLLVSGCMAQECGSAILEGYEDVDAVIGTGKLNSLPNVLADSKRCALLGAGGLLESKYQRILSNNLSYAYLKVSEGCNHKCSFCIIPALRGRQISRSIISVAREAGDLACLGIKELVIVAQDSTSYGLDRYGSFTLDKLLRRFSRIDGIEWVRLLYAYPSSVTPALLDEIKKNSKVCKYIDMPLQHISKSVLRSMRRPSGALEAVERIKESVPEIALRTTFITGYPGESEHDFSQLCRFLEKGYFDHAGIFAYSHESTARKRGLKDTISPEVKSERMSQLMAIQRQVSLKKNKARIGSIESVHVDYVTAKRFRNKFNAFGRASFQAPEIDGRTYLKGNILQGTIIKARITGADAYDLFAEEIIL